MIKLEKIGNESNPDIRISDGTKSFMIARNNLPDLCWYPEINYFRSDEDIIFVITENDKEIYTLFDMLYLDIIDGNIFSLTEDDLQSKSPEEVKIAKQKNDKENVKCKKRAQDTNLVQGDNITLHSEDYDEYDFASVLEIKKSDNQIEIIFKKNKKNLDSTYMQIPTYNIRITESFGRYWPLNVIFSSFRRKLQKFTLDNTSFSETKKDEFQKVLKK